jgi:hypothetical protein
LDRRRWNPNPYRTLSLHIAASTPALGPPGPRG